MHSDGERKFQQKSEHIISMRVCRFYETKKIYIAPKCRQYATVSGWGNLGAKNEGERRRKL